jgi:hypothetical protein|uniref:Uncharacterized protein n=1 Tax=viral metagenome TaxID=1070528 RepID=A0A6C0C384_9ZZZZ
MLTFITQQDINYFFEKTMIILAIAGAFLYIRILIIKMKFKFPSDKKYKLDKVVVIEKFDSKILENIENKKKYDAIKKKGFCNNIGMDKKCGEFDNKTACTTVDCCVWAKNKNGSKCVPGDINGPQMQKDKSLTKYDEFYYLNKNKKLVN